MFRSISMLLEEASLLHSLVLKWADRGGMTCIGCSCDSFANQCAGTPRPRGKSMNTLGQEFGHKFGLMDVGVGCDYGYSLIFRFATWMDVAGSSDEMRLLPETPHLRPALPGQYGGVVRTQLLSPCCSFPSRSARTQSRRRSATSAG